MTPAQQPPLDAPRLLETLQRHQVEYLLVGGLSTRARGAERLTDDLDCLPAATPQNLRRLTAALQELNARLRIDGLSDDEVAALPIDTQAVLDVAEISNWITDAGSLDVIKSMPDAAGRPLSYADLRSRSEPLPLGQITMQVASLEDVIASKEWTDRPKDRDALDELRALRDASFPSPSSENPPPTSAASPNSGTPGRPASPQANRPDACR